MRKKIFHQHNKFFLFFLSIVIFFIFFTHQGDAQVYTANLAGSKQVPPNTSPASGTMTVTLLPDGVSGRINLAFTRLLGTEVNAHIHGPAAAGDTNAIIFIIPLGSTINNYAITFNPLQLQWLKSGLLYGDVHSSIYPDGEIRDQLVLSSGSNPTSTPTLTPTRIPVITMTSTPTPTISFGHTIFSISTCPHGLGNCGDNVSQNAGGNKNPQHTQRNVTITVLNNTGQTVATQQGTIIYNPSSGLFAGTIDMGTLPSNNYLVKEKIDGFLATQLPGIITVSAGTTSILPTVTHITGDINNDNKIDILDYNLLLNCYGSKQNTSTCISGPNTQSPGADLNDDGVVNGIDYNLFLRELSVQAGV